MRHNICCQEREGNYRFDPTSNRKQSNFSLGKKILLYSTAVWRPAVWNSATKIHKKKVQVVLVFGNKRLLCRTIIVLTVLKGAVVLNQVTKTHKKENEVVLVFRNKSQLYRKLFGHLCCMELQSLFLIELHL